MPWTWNRVGSFPFLVVQGSRPGSFFCSRQDEYYRARATIDRQVEVKSELADSVADRKKCHVGRDVYGYPAGCFGRVQSIAWFGSVCNKMSE